MSENYSKKQLRNFGILIGLFFPIILGYVLPTFFGDEFKIWTLVIAIPSLFLSLISPNLLFYPYKYWIKIGDILGWVNSRLILGIIFIVILLPIAFFMQIFGYDPLKKKIKNVKTFKDYKKSQKIDLTRIF